MYKFMLSIRYNRQSKSFQVFLFKQLRFSLVSDFVSDSIYSRTFYCYFKLLKVLRSFGLIVSLKNLRDFF